jgi:pimeloyl-ACP methyl ester carboxylesterase
MTAIVVIHGLWMNGASMELLRRRLEPKGFEMHVFRYPSVREGLTANALRLADFVAAIPGERVHMLGHSLGGVLVRAMLDVARPIRPGRVVCLGSPFAGSQIAARIARWPAGTRLLGKSIGELLARGGYADWRPPLELGVVAGGVPIGFGRLVGGFREPSDGTVAVAETRVQGATDHIVLPVSHFSMLWSPLVLDQVLAFLADGRFRRDAAA